MTGNAEIILIRADGALLLQRRDDKPGITNPGLITAFGGHIEPGETPLEAAHREINEETNLNLGADDLKFFGKYRKTKAVHGEDWEVYYHLVSNIDDANLRVFEGQGFVVVHDRAEARKLKTSVLMRQVLEDYYDSRE
jgi:8-oxo-dGTP pyrophosphatase MutT (NUDIX family)